MRAVSHVNCSALNPQPAHTISRLTRALDSPLPESTQFTPLQLRFYSKVKKAGSSPAGKKGASQSNYQRVKEASASASADKSTGFRHTIPVNRAPRSTQSTEFTFNPIIFNVKHEKYVEQGKERAVGWWLGLVSASIFGMVVLGGYTRLTKSGLSMVRWEPQRILPPMSQEEWEKEFEEYKKSPEWI